MAVLQKIRNRGILLVSIIAIALFLFVMGDLLRGGEGLINQSRQNVGEIDGTSVSIQDYQSVFEDFQVYNEIAQQRTSTSEEENNQLKDMAWNTMIQNKLIEKECNALGIGVTDDEVAEVIRSGQNQLLQVPAFANQQTGRYDYAQLTTFLNEYKRLKDAGEQIPEVYEKLYKYYMFVQKQVRSQLLANKYQTLASKCVMSNPVEAKQTFEDRANESDVLLVSIPFTSVADDKVTVSDADIEAKYKAEKEKYKQYVESRDVKLIDVQVVTSDADRKALQEVVSKGKSPAKAILRANILLASDRNNKKHMTVAEIAETYHTTPTTVQNVRTSYANNGLEATIARKKRETPPVPPKVTGDVEAHIIALACGDPPEGYEKWTLRLLADKCVELNYAESLSHMTVSRILKKTNLSLN